MARQANINNIICRSSWEEKFCGYCDLNENIIQWGSEEFFIPYRAPDGKTRRYFPDFIIKSILAEDIEDMEKYGIYECDHEDFALCAYACQSKIEVSSIIKDGLQLAEREG